jgi:hypothetical protein
MRKEQHEPIFETIFDVARKEKGSHIFENIYEEVRKEKHESHLQKNVNQLI